MKDKKDRVINALCLVAGCLIYSVGVIMFVEPNKLSPGGATGLAVLINYLYGVPTGVSVLLINIPLIILGYRSFGKSFIFKTAVAAFILSISLEIAEFCFKAYYTNGILASLFGGVLMGVGLGLVFLRGATTGGTDIAAKLIHKRFPFLQIGRIILGIDLVIILLTGIVYKNIESMLYSLVSLYTATRVVDSVLGSADRGKILYIVTEKSGEIREAVCREMERTVTTLSALGGYSGQEKKVVLCAVRPHEVGTLLGIVKRTDGKAFVMITDAGEILGEGFKIHK